MSSDSDEFYDLDEQEVPVTASSTLPAEKYYFRVSYQHSFS